MFGLFRKAKHDVVSFCERCGSVCDHVCRADARREQARRQLFAYGWRQV